MSVRRRLGLYEKSILPKRKKYVNEHRCVDCGKDSETFRCDACNTNRNAYMKKWRIKNKDHVVNCQREWRSKNKDKIKMSNKKAQAKQYGLTVEEYAAAVKTQCGICGKVKTKHCIDHCHITNKVRGVLCSGCNSMLGWYEKNKQSIEKWINEKCCHKEQSNEGRK